MVGSRPKLMTHEQHQHSRALDSFAVFALVITFFLRYADFLTAHLLFGPYVDNVHMYGPIFSEVSRLALGAAVPYYLPDIGTGFPVFETPHFSILYPFYFLGLINYGGPLASLYTLTYLTLVHLFVFYINLYVLLRCAAIAPWASYIGASVGMLAWNMHLYASWVTIIASYAWLPLVLAGGVLLLRFPGKACGILVFSIAAGLLALASPSQPVIHTALSCLILFGTGIGWLSLQRRFADLRRLACSLAICVGVVFGLAGAAMLPMYMATGEMVRAIGRGAGIIGHAPIPWEHFNLAQLSLSEAAGILVTPTWIHIIGSPYVGPLGVIGTLLTLIYFRRLDPFLRMLVLAFGIVALYGLLSGFGTNLGFAYINFHLPFINRIREAGRHLVLFVIGVSLLSGLGYSLLAQSCLQHKQTHQIRQLILPALLLLIFAGVIVWELCQYDYRFWPARFWIICLAPILFALGCICKLRGSGDVVSAATLVSAAAMVVPIWGVPLSRSDFTKPINLLSHRVIRDVVGKINANGYRMDFRDATFPASFWAMNASYYGIRSFYNQLTPQPYDQARFTNLMNIPHLRALMGARYVLCGSTYSPTDAGATEMLETEGYRLYENANPMGRLTLVHRVAGDIDSEAGFIRIIGKGFNYLSEAYVTSSDFKKVRDFLGNPRTSATQGRILKIVDEPNRSYSSVKCNSASLLILNEWFTPAWKVWVNGMKRRALRVNQWQTGVILPAGKNRVEFEYRPTLFRALMVLNRITIGLLLSFMILTIVRKTPRKTPRSC